MKVLFTKRRGCNIPSMIFRWIDKADFSHVALLIETHYGSLVVQSTHIGIHAISFRDFIKHNSIIKMIHLNPTVEQKILIMENIYRLLGVSYGFISIAGAALARMFHMSKNILGDGDKTEFCSEFAYDVLEEAYGLHGFLAEIDGPKKLYEILHLMQLKAIKENENA